MPVSVPADIIHCLPYIHYTCQCLCLLILSIVFHTFVNLKTSNAKYILKDFFICPFPEFHNSPLYLCNIVLESILDMFIFTLSCSFWDHSFKMSACINLVHCITAILNQLYTSVPCYIGSESCLCFQEMWLIWVVLN